MMIHGVTTRSAVLRKRGERGQSLAVAIIVMFVLLFIGGLFVALVARNLLNSGRATDTIEALRLAQSGYEYVSNMLENSPEGADWRPQPPAAAPTDPVLLNVHNADPDRRWLDAGYSRIPLGRGRALVRVEYTPDPRSPLGKYVRIRSVGRVGEISENDPTTFVDPETGSVPRLRREQLAVKALGITDYLRYVTNISRDRNAEAALGVPPFGVPLSMQLGGMPQRFLGGGQQDWWKLQDSLGGFPTVGAPIQVNCGLRLLGDITLGIRPHYDPSTLPTGALKYPWEAESVRVAGDIVMETGASVKVADLEKGGTTPVLASSDPDFTTVNGMIRDARGVPDKNGFSRNAVYQAPPNLDAVDGSTGVGRYAASTRNSGVTLTRQDGTSFNTGEYGLGNGLYIDNVNNFERESQAVDGGQSLRSIWMSPGSTQNWSGPYYIPPGAFVEFGSPVAQERDASGDPVAGSYISRPGFRVVRDASDRPFRDPNGNVATREQAFTYFIYKPRGQRPVLKVENDFFRAFLASPRPGMAQGMTNAEIDRLLPAFNGVIYAEGNLRVRGFLAARTNASIPIRREAGDTDTLTDDEVRARVNPPAVNVVSAATIYIEGSIVRESPESMIGLLARNCVAINTTLFVAPNKSMAWSGSNQDEQPPYHTTIGVSEAATAPPFSVDYMNGEDVSEYGTPVYLLARHGAQAGTSFLNLLVNDALAPSGKSPFYNFSVLPGSPIVLPLAVADAQNGSDGFRQHAIQLYPVPAAPSSPYDNVAFDYFTARGARNTVRPQVDPNYSEGSGTQDYLLGRYAIAPMDVRIEAVIYAQEGSFYVIPGYPVNPNPNDTRIAAVQRGQALGFSDGRSVRPTGTSLEFPYYGEPVDCRLTIVGAISENRTAPVADQTAWMQLWGYIPDHHGSSPQSVPVAHVNVDEVGGAAIDPRTTAEQNCYVSSSDITVRRGITRGIRYLYDPSLLAPYPSFTPLVNNRTADPLRPQLEQPAPTWIASRAWAYTPGGTYRQDDYGRYLPPIPRLPVCPGYLYVGEERLAGLFGG